MAVNSVYRICSLTFSLVKFTIHLSEFPPTGALINELYCTSGIATILAQTNTINIRAIRAIMAEVIAYNTIILKWLKVDPVAPQWDPENPNGNVLFALDLWVMETRVVLLHSCPDPLMNVMRMSCRTSQLCKSSALPTNCAHPGFLVKPGNTQKLSAAPEANLILLRFKEIRLEHRQLGLPLSLRDSSIESHIECEERKRVVGPLDTCEMITTLTVNEQTWIRCVIVLDSNIFL